MQSQEIGGKTKFVKVPLICANRGNINISVKTPAGKQIDLQVHDLDTIELVKTMIKDLEGIPVD